MKRLIAVLIMISILVFTISAAADKKSGKYTYRVLEDNTAFIIKCSITSASTITVPAKIGGYKVSKVSSSAFQYASCKKLVFSEGITELVGTGSLRTKEIVIPSSMISMGDFGEYISFNDSTDLEKITVHKDNPVFMSENDCLINKQTQELLYYPVAAKTQKIQIPYDVKSIARYAFYGVKYLEEVTFSEGVESISEYNFCKCENLKSINLPSTLSMADYNGKIFRDCPEMTSITVPYGNRHLKIDNNALIDLKSHKLIYMPQKAKVKTYIVPRNVKDIEKDAFEGCVYLVNVKIPGTVEIIESHAFANCKNLKNVVMEKGIKYISYHAFIDSPKIKDLQYPVGAVEFYATPSPYATEDDLKYGN